LKPQAIYLVRHGESEGNIDEGIYKTIPDWQIGLTPKGKKQAVEARHILYKDIQENLPIPNWGNRAAAFIYSSPLRRAKQTAETINCSFKAKIFYDPRLREQEWGNYAEDQIVKKVAKERKRFSTFYYRMPNGESGADVYDRVTTVLDTMFRDFAKENFPWNVIIVSHGLTIKAFLMRWFHWDPQDFDNYRNLKNCEIVKMLMNDKGKYDLVTPLRKRKKVNCDH
jgi:broad specificity phosphatase PhoE